MRYREIQEKYSQENKYLLQHLSDTSFDPYAVWWEIANFCYSNGYLDEIGEAIGEELEDPEDLGDLDAEVYEQFPEHIRKEIEDNVIDYMMQHNPADAPSSAFLSVNRPQLLPRTTWLIHFSDNAHDISRNGFVYGMDDMDKLGLTTYFQTGSGYKAAQGYNFAFEARSREANWAAHKGKYGKHAVMFMNSGVHAYHYSDEENQVIFWGADVDPRSTVLLVNDYGDWKTYDRRTDRVLFQGEFEKAVQWVIQNYRQYRNVLS